MIKRLFWDERGDLSFFTIFVILSINMVMAFLLLFATIRIECINIPVSYTHLDVYKRQPYKENLNRTAGRH